MLIRRVRCGADPGVAAEVTAALHQCHLGGEG